MFIIGSFTKTPPESIKQLKSLIFFCILEKRISIKILSIISSTISILSYSIFLAFSIFVSKVFYSAIL
jgi:hypothetical protein